MSNDRIKSLRSHTKNTKIAKFTKVTPEIVKNVSDMKIKQGLLDKDKVVREITDNSLEIPQEITHEIPDFPNVQIIQDAPKTRPSLICSIPMANVVRAIVNHADKSLEPERLDDYYSSYGDDERPRTPGRSLELLFELLSNRNVKSLNDWSAHPHNVPVLQEIFEESAVPQDTTAEGNVSETNSLNAWWSNAINMAQTQVPTITIKEEPLDVEEDLLNNNYLSNIKAPPYNAEGEIPTLENIPPVEEQQSIVQIEQEPEEPQLTKAQTKRNSKQSPVNIKQEVDDEFDPEVLNNIKQESQLEPRAKYSRIVKLRNRRPIKVTFVEPRPMKMEPIEIKEEPCSPTSSRSSSSPASPSSPEWNKPKSQKKACKTSKKRKL